MYADSLNSIHPGTIGSNTRRSIFRLVLLFTFRWLETSSLWHLDRNHHLKSATMSAAVPASVTGGCLCGAVRYTITVPPEEQGKWPRPGNSTCQCTQCRKFTGSLVARDITTLTAWIAPPFEQQPTLKFYRSSNFARRSFCTTCGSSVAFHYVEQPDRVEIYAGGLDEELLRSAAGSALVNADGHCWVRNAVVGVTDGLLGPKWLGEQRGRGSSAVAQRWSAASRYCHAGVTLL